MRRKIILGLILICYLVIIFMFSNQDATVSQSTSDVIVDQISKVSIFSNLDLSYIVRKSAHFIFFGGLGLVFYLNYCEYFINKKNIFILSIVSTFIYACFDEIHQTFISGRSGQVSDVILDSIGAITVVIIYILIKKKMSK